MKEEKEHDHLRQCGRHIAKHTHLEIDGEAYILCQQCRKVTAVRLLSLRIHPRRVRLHATGDPGVPGYLDGAYGCVLVHYRTSLSVLPDITQVVIRVRENQVQDIEEG